MVNTTIKISEPVKKILDKLKVHPRQSYDEVIKFLLEQYKKYE